MFPHRIQILGHTFNLFFLKDESRETLLDREVTGGVTTDPDPCRNWLEDSSSDFLQGLTCFFMLMPPLLRMTTDPDPCRKAKAGGSRMLILGAGELETNEKL